MTPTRSPDPIHDWRRPLGIAAALATVIALGALTAFSAKVLALEPEARVGYVPDDGYYYLQLARHFGQVGRWTFDDGVSETSGFHLLLAYVLVPISWLARSLDVEFDTLGIIATVLMTAAAWAVPLALAGRYRAAAALGAGAVFVAWPSMGNSVAIVEWPLVVVLDGSLAVLILRGGEAERPSRTWLFVAIGFAGSLARTDFGLWPAALTAAAYIVRRTTGDAAPVRAAAAALIGAVAGLLAASAHHAMLSGSMIQSSVLVKAHWVSITGGDFRRPIYLLEAMSVPLARPLDGPVAAVAAIAGCVALAILLRRATAPRAELREWGAGPATLAIASVLALAGYIIVYSRNGDVQPWYSAHLVTPVAVLFACAVGLCLRSGVAPVAIASVVSMLALSVVRTADSLRRPPTWPHQADMMMAGALLRSEHPGERVAAWNAGVLAYHYGGTVVNLDGLVNNAAARAVVSNRLEDYVVATGITRIADFASMVTDPSIRARGGYAEPFASIRLEPEVVFEDVLNRDWSRMTIFRVAPIAASPSNVQPRRIDRTPGSGSKLRWGYYISTAK